MMVHAESAFSTKLVDTLLFWIGSLAGVALLVLMMTSWSPWDNLVAGAPVSLSDHVLSTCRFGVSCPAPMPWHPPIYTAFEYPGSTYYVFNPSVLPLPPLFRHRFLVIARFLDRSVHALSGKPIESFNSLIWCFMREPMTESRLPLNRPGQSVWPAVLTCSTVPEPIQLHVGLSGLDLDGYQLFRGPEDPRLFWGPRNEPLLIYGQNSLLSSRQRTVWVVDCRTLIAQLAGLSAGPVEFDRPTELFADTPAMVTQPIEKNCALSTRLSALSPVIAVDRHCTCVLGSPLVAPSGLLFRYSILPHVLVQPETQSWKSPVEAIRHDGQLRNVSVLRNDTSEQAMTCLRHFDTLLHPYHQSTNTLRLLLTCHHGCDPERRRVPHKFLYLQIAHHRLDIVNVKRQWHLEYIHYLLLLTPDHQLFAISRVDLPNLETSRCQKYILSINYMLDDHHTQYDFGTLDSVIAMSLGQGDQTAQVTFIAVADLVRDMIPCESN